ncbi:adhesion G protein-coupled receptor B1 [Hydra vulgaris]|uniref:adhesion G protein-coupled receptor B1 n=1 Tax=Hydra vulgaris TaxID=6087 RepID=UPI001F5F9230|nr:adhesion G protein-coupled receptor B1-like [Hydra vulgaris]
MIWKIYILCLAFQFQESSTQDLSNWSEWGECSSTCQLDMIPKETRTRSCSPDSLNDCNDEPLIEYRNCKENVPCPGRLSDWTQWGPCSATCYRLGFEPFQKRIRTCTDTSFGGNCGGRTLSDVRFCNMTTFCPGTLSNWTEWGKCSCQLGDSTPSQQRRRTCKGASLGGNCNNALLKEVQFCKDLAACKKV